MIEQPLLTSSEFKSNKRRRKRKDLDKLLNGRSNRIRRKSGHELLQMDSYSDSSDDGTLAGFSHQQYKRVYPCSNSLPYMNLLLTVLSCVASAVLLWLFIIMRGQLASFQEQKLQDAKTLTRYSNQLKELFTQINISDKRVSILIVNLTHCLSQTANLTKESANSSQGHLSNLLKHQGEQISSQQLELTSLKQQYRDLYELLHTPLVQINNSLSHVTQIMSHIELGVTKKLPKGREKGVLITTEEYKTVAQLVERSVALTKTLSSLDARIKVLESTSNSTTPNR